MTPAPRSEQRSQSSAVSPRGVAAGAPRVAVRPLPGERWAIEHGEPRVWLFCSVVGPAREVLGATVYETIVDGDRRGARLVSAKRFRHRLSTARAAVGLPVNLASLKPRRLARVAVRDIRRRSAAGATAESLALEYRVPVATIAEVTAARTGEALPDAPPRIPPPRDYRPPKRQVVRREARVVAESPRQQSLALPAPVRWTTPAAEPGRFAQLKRLLALVWGPP